MGVEVVTFGCRLNAYESEAIGALATAATPDTIVVNTCAVTEEAVRQARQAIRRLKRERPASRIVVTGCAAQVEAGRFAAMPEVARVIGNGEKLRPETWRGLDDPGMPRVAVTDIMAQDRVDAPPVSGNRGLPRAFLPVQNGCDHRCTFCIIPYGRGNSRSVPMGAVVDQVKRLVGNGAAEVVVTGVDVTSYGRDLPGRPALGTLVQTILRHVPDLPRLRISSIDSVEADEALVETMASEGRLMPHLHLSLQAGDDLILKRMKRRHSRDDAIRFCAAMRTRRPGIVFGADIIAGFPTETEAMFARSLDLIADCGLTYLHVFPFSPRQGTPAARMPQLPAAIVKERAARLREAGRAALARHLAAQVGRTLPVLVENALTGRTEHYATVRLTAPAPTGAILPVAITDIRDDALLGTASANEPATGLHDAMQTVFLDFADARP